MKLKAELMNSWALMKKKHMANKHQKLIVTVRMTSSIIIATVVPWRHALIKIECVDEWPELMKSLCTRQNLTASSNGNKERIWMRMASGSPLKLSSLKTQLLCFEDIFISWNINLLALDNKILAKVICVLC